MIFTHFCCSHIFSNKLEIVAMSSDLGSVYETCVTEFMTLNPNI